MNEIEKKEAWWKPGIVLFIRISGWIAVPIIIGLYLGKYLDTKYDTTPWMFIGMMALAFTTSMIAIARIAIKYINEIEINNKSNKKDIEYDTRN
jgi:F0F1-type ATP synthase assembly protein I